MAGYSGTPLAKKLGIKEGSRLFLSGAPKNYLQLVAPLPKGVKLVPRIDGKTDIVHIFSTERARLKATLGLSLNKVETRRIDLGVLAEKIVQSSHRHHRRHHQGSGLADGPG